MRRLFIWVDLRTEAGHRQLSTWLCSIRIC